MKWSDFLPADVYTRLAECRSTESDLPILVNARWRYMVEQGKDKQGYTKEDALVSVLELLDCNGLFFDLTRDEYDELKK